MEGSSPQRPANFGALDPSIVNGSGPGPMAQVPVGGGPGGAPAPAMAAAAPGPAAFSMPTPPQPAQQQPVPQPPVQQPYNPMPPGVAELNAPVESILLTELQELKDAFRHVRKITLVQGAALFCIALAVIFYLSNSLQSKITPEVA